MTKRTDANSAPTDGSSLPVRIGNRLHELEEDVNLVNRISPRGWLAELVWNLPFKAISSGPGVALWLRCLECGQMWLPLRSIEQPTRTSRGCPNGCGSTGSVRVPTPDSRNYTVETMHDADDRCAEMVFLVIDHRRKTISVAEAAAGGCLELSDADHRELLELPSHASRREIINALEEHYLCGDIELEEIPSHVFWYGSFAEAVGGDKEMVLELLSQCDSSKSMVDCANSVAGKVQDRLGNRVTFEDNEVVTYLTSLAQLACQNGYDASLLPDVFQDEVSRQ